MTSLFETATEALVKLGLELIWLGLLSLVAAGVWSAYQKYSEVPEWQEAYQEYQDENTTAYWFRSTKTGEWRLDKVVKAGNPPLIFTSFDSPEYRDAYARKPYLSIAAPTPGHS